MLSVAFPDLVEVDRVVGAATRNEYRQLERLAPKVREIYGLSRHKLAAWLQRDIYLLPCFKLQLENYLEELDTEIRAKHDE